MVLDDRYKYDDFFSEIRALEGGVVKYIKHFEHRIRGLALENKFKGRILIMSTFGDYLNFDKLQYTLDKDYQYFIQTGKLNNYYVLLNTQRNYERLAEKYKDVLTIYNIPSSQTHYNYGLQLDKYVLDKNISKTFLSLNNRATWYRQALFYFFIKFGLLEKSYFSYRMHDVFGQPDIFKHTNDAGAGHYLNAYGLDEARVRSMIPYTIENDSMVPSGDWGFGDNKFYNDTFCSVIAETYVETDNPFITEKTLKPFGFYHPFLLFGGNGCLDYIRSMGFETFDEVFDESYDLIVEHSARLEAVCNEVLRISKLSNNELILLNDKISKKLKHNRNRLVNIWPEEYSKQILVIQEELKTLILEKQNLME